jgi:adenine-specific DNA-methyltransferase
VWVIPNVKHNHVEKTAHPCQFPVELVERLVLALTKPGDLVVDPYIGSGTTAVAALLHQRRVAGADTVHEFIRIAESRVRETLDGSVRTRPRGRAVYKPQGPLAENPFVLAN